MSFEEWSEIVPSEIRADSLWRMQAYRLALYLGDLAWPDVTTLSHRRTLDLSGELYRSAGSISANIEGCSRGTSKDRARFYEYSLGSARECRDWYWKGRHVLSMAVATERIQLMSSIIRLLLTMAPEQRAGSIREESTTSYLAEPQAEGGEM